MQFFKCEKDCGVFVGLDKLSESSVPAVTKSPSSPPAVTKSPSSPLAVTKSPSSPPAVTKSPSSPPAVIKSPSSPPAVTKSPSSATSDSNCGDNILQKERVFKILDKVMAFDDDGGTVYGNVKWIGRNPLVPSVSKELVGIETVSS